MKRTIIISSLLLFLVSCNDGDSGKPNADSQMGETKEELFQTQPASTDDSLWIKLKQDLRTEKFAIEDVMKEKRYTEYDGNRKVNVTVRGEGITKYIIKRQEAKPAGYYPDFALYVFDMESVKQAKQCFSALTFARFSPGRGEERTKDVELMTQNGRRIFILSTRAEMFRTYVTDFAQKLNKY